MTRYYAPTLEQEDAFIQAVLYASLFEYPLTVDQLRESLVGEVADEQMLVRWYEGSRRLQAAVDCHNGYFFPRGQIALLELRHQREALSRDLLEVLDRPLRFVTLMPFVRMVALSGSLAHLNATKDADLDLFVVTSRGRVWGVTLTVLLLARLFGWRRRLCLNYVISERRLGVEPRDLFTANQIIHLRPLLGETVYLKFLNANAFVRTVYPNFEPRRVTALEPRRVRALFERVLDLTVAPLYERACRALYTWHLQKRSATWHSRDQVRLEPECLKLHTSSHRADVMRRFEEALATEAPNHGGNHGNMEAGELKTDHARRTKLARV